MILSFFHLFSLIDIVKMLPDYTIIQPEQHNNQDIEKLLPKVRKSMQYTTASFFFIDYTNLYYSRPPAIIAALQ
jgi:hypothetical protein